MKSSDLRAIANRGQAPAAQEINADANGAGTRKKWTKKDYFFWGFVGLCFMSASGNIFRTLEAPEVQQARLAEQAQREQNRVVERKHTELNAAKQAKEGAKLARLESCIKMQNFAYPASKNEVRARLKAPTTASFPWTPIVSQHIGDCKFQVLAYVDAQNGFGAMIRSNYVATLTYDPAAERWRVTSVKLEN